MADDGTTPGNGSALQIAAVSVAALLAVGAGIWFGYAPTREPAPQTVKQAVEAPAATPAPAKAAMALPPAPAALVPPPSATPAPTQSAASTPAPAGIATPVAPPAPIAPARPGVPAASAPAAAPPAAAAKAEETPAKPSFDIVRVNPQGAAVMAGRAAPGAEVTVAENGKAIGSTKADDAGQWVLLPQKPISPGNSELTVASREPDQTPIAGAAPVVILMPEHPATQAAASGAPAAPASASAPVVLLAPNDAVPKLLQPPSAAADAAPGRSLGLATVDYTDRGDIRFSGTAPPGTTVRTYIDNKPMGDAAADDKGHWTLLPKDPVATGDHQLRLDELGKKGVAARIELPFQRAELSPQAVAPGSIVVQPGQNLWRIARHTYGRGIQYVVIYRANHEQIRDPNLIYPGQVFAMPAAEKASATQ